MAALISDIQETAARYGLQKLNKATKSLGTAENKLRGNLQ